MKPTKLLLLAITAASIALAGCAAETSSDSSDPAADTSATDTSTTTGGENTAQTTEELTAKFLYKDTKAAIDSNCGGCHAQFKTLAGIKADKTNMASMIKAGAMPKGNPTWKSGADGKKVLSWLKTGADLK